MFGKLLSCSLLIAAPVMAQDFEDRDALALKGSDTLAGYMSDLIETSGVQGALNYQGGGSGQGETALVAKTQHITAMSRAFKADQLAKAEEAGVKIVEHVIGLDGIGLFVNAANTTPALTFDQLKKIYSCEVSNWSSVGGKDAPIVAYRRNDSSGTTDTFKSVLGLTAFGTCVKVKEDTADIAKATATEANAVGYSGLSAGVSGNKALAVAKDAAAKAYVPTLVNIRSFNYPLTRKLYIYEAAGSLNAAEKTLLGNALDRSVSDPLIAKHEFITID